MEKIHSRHCFLELYDCLSSYSGIAQQRKARRQSQADSAGKVIDLLPYYFGKAQGIFDKEGVDLEIIIMRPPLGVTALVAGDLDYSAAGGLSIRAAMKGVPLEPLYLSKPA